jgi:hypothetical protein
MADYLTIDGDPIPIAIDTGEEVPELIGERGRNIDRSLLQDGVIKRKWPGLRTPPLLPEVATPLRNKLVAATNTAPLACAGDVIGGAVDCVAEITGIRKITLGGGQRRHVLTFTLIEV